MCLTSIQCSVCKLHKYHRCCVVTTTQCLYNGLNNSHLSQLNHTIFATCISNICCIVCANSHVHYLNQIHSIMSKQHTICITFKSHNTPHVINTQIIMCELITS